MLDRVEASGWKGASRRVLRRVSPATAISIVALFVALSGTAYAATGGTFILGKANSATSVSSLTNTGGTALRLSSKTGTAPLTVNSSKQVPNLNASLLGGQSASAFFQVDTAGGALGTGTKTLFNQSTGFLVGTWPDAAFALEGSCDPSGPGSGVELLLNDDSSNTATIYTLTASGSGETAASGGGGSAVLLAANASFDMVIAQVIAGTRVLTIVATERYIPFAGSDECDYSGQIIASK
jgi:hypothetical protein